jgi:two-component system, cell cycle sensor histidine kinase and response regulator CckA
MPPFPGHRPVWPSRWAELLRERLLLLRLLTLLLALLALWGSMVLFGFERGPHPVVTVAAMLGVSVLWTLGFRKGLPLAALPVELCLLSIYLLGVNPEFRPFGAMFLALEHRSLYGTRLQATVVAFAYAAVFVAGNAFHPDPVLGTPLAVTLQLGIGAFGAYVMHTLAEVLTRDRERGSTLLRSEERYRAMFHHNPWPMWLYDPGTLRLADVNESAIRHYGYSRQEFLAMSLYDLRPEADREAFRSLIATMGTERSTHLVQHIKKDGEVIDVEVTGHPVQFDGRELRLAVGVDVSARMRTERALRESESRFRSVANCLREALLITDVDDRMVLANERVRAVLGYEPADVIGKIATNLLLPVHERNAFRDRLRRRMAGETELYEVELVRADGRIIFAEVSASPYRDSTGRIVGTLGAISDITDRKRLEERLRQGLRLEAVGQLAGGVAHDFNNLLTVIKCHAELMRDDLPRGDALQANVMEIERAADRAAEVTAQLLAFSRKQHMQPRRLSLDSVVVEALPVLRQLAGAQVEIVTNSDPVAREVRADPTQMENVLVTLVRNACEAMPTGGRITVRTGTEHLPEQEFELQNQHVPAGWYSVMVVSDTGAGMDRTTQQRLFEPFFTTKGVGSGTGLALASLYGIVRQSGGFVDVKSAPSQGTTFSIYLPALGPTQSATAPLQTA